MIKSITLVLVFAMITSSVDAFVLEKTRSGSVNDNAFLDSSLCVSNDSSDIWSRIADKQEWFMLDTKPLSTIDSIPVEFQNFYAKFISDSIFQIESIDISFLAVMAECESTVILNPSNWTFFRYDFRLDFDNRLDSNAIYYNEQKFYFQQFRKEVGLLFCIGFEKTNGFWLLTLYEDVNC